MTTVEQQRLRIAYSPCPNDTFVFDAHAHGRVPGAPARGSIYGGTLSSGVDW